MRLSETVEEMRVALDLFPLCVRCGATLDPNRLTQLVQVSDRSNRYAHIICPKAIADAA